MWITWKRVGCYLLLVIGYAVLFIGAAMHHQGVTPELRIMGMLFWVWLWYAWKLAGKATV